MNTASVPGDSAKQTETTPKTPPSTPLRPEWIRLPLGGPCRWTGLTRSKMNELILPCAKNGFKPPVRSVCLAPLGTKKGVRLMHLASLLDYLHARSEGGDADPHRCPEPKPHDNALSRASVGTAQDHPAKSEA